jgi:hypothetical protein
MIPPQKFIYPEMGYSKIESSMISCWKDKNMNSSDPNSKKLGYLLAYFKKT